MTKFIESFIRQKTAKLSNDNLGSKVTKHIEMTNATEKLHEFGLIFINTSLLHSLTWILSVVRHYFKALQLYCANYQVSPVTSNQVNLEIQKKIKD